MNKENEIIVDPKDCILYFDDDIVIINKLQGLVCEITEDKDSSIPLIYKPIIEEKLGHKVSLIECPHRLDKTVSGVQIIALNNEAFTNLTNQFAQHKVEKTYFTVVEGVGCCKKEDRLEHYIRFNPIKQKAIVTEEEARKSKKAILTYKLLGEGERYSFLEVKLLTGRTHQIRAQLAYCGFHIKGDVKYGARRSDTLNGIRLHARNIKFTHPKTKKEVYFQADMPIIDPLWQAFLDEVK